MTDVHQEATRQMDTSLHTAGLSGTEGAGQVLLS